jgi:hypothetical protein
LLLSAPFIRKRRLVTYHELLAASVTPQGAHFLETSSRFLSGLTLSLSPLLSSTELLRVRSPLGFSRIVFRFQNLLFVGACCPKLLFGCLLFGIVVSPTSIGHSTSLGCSQYGQMMPCGGEVVV